MKTRVLFIHAPKSRNFYLPLSQYFYINMVPQGMFAIVDLIHRHQFPTRFIHLGLKYILNPHYHLAQDLRAQPVDVVLLSLHWHHQSYDVIETARWVKATLPEAVIVLGGFTATHFARDLVQDYPFIDAVICGHGDQPALQLLRQIEAGESWQSVPNLVYRQAGAIKVNPTLYAHTAETISELRYANLGLLEDHAEYVRTFGYPLEYQPSLTQQENIDQLYVQYTLFPLATGVGCPVRCTNCSANRHNLKALTGSGKVIWRSPESVIADMERAIGYGYKGFILGFDPAPRKPTYYLELFAQIRAQGIRVMANYECWGLPTREFIESFSQTFTPEDSVICLTPETPSERLRELNRGYHYTNEEFFATLEVMREYGVKTIVFFSLVLPEERLEEAWETKRWVERLYRDYADIVIAVMVWPVILEPGSPMFLNPESLGIETKWKNFADYYAAHRDGEADGFHALGYKVNGYFGDERDVGSVSDFEREVMKLRCEHFCMMFHADPQQSRQLCLTRRQTLYQQAGLPSEGLEVFSATRDMYGDLADFKRQMAARGQTIFPYRLLPADET